MSGIFDTHAHYDDESFDEDRAALLSSLPSKGVELVMNCATNPSSVKSSLALAKKYDFIYAAIGFHPEDLNPLRLEQLDDIKRLAQSESKVKAIGEIGLDYYWKEVSPEKQIAFFEAQILLAKELDLPIIVHDREAHEDTYALLLKYKPKGVLHSHRMLLHLVDCINQGLWMPTEESFYEDADALVREFCENYYGKAAAPLMLEYIADLERLARLEAAAVPPLARAAPAPVLLAALERAGRRVERRAAAAFEDGERGDVVVVLVREQDGVEVRERGAERRERGAERPAVRPRVDEQADAAALDEGGVARARAGEDGELHRVAAEGPRASARRPAPERGAGRGCGSRSPSRPRCGRWRSPPERTCGSSASR